MLDFCDETPRTAQEILDMVGVKYHTKTLDQYINKLVDADNLTSSGGNSLKNNRNSLTTLQALMVQVVQAVQPMTP